MSYELGTKIKLKEPWRAYSAGCVLEQGFEVDLESLVRLGIAEPVVEDRRPGRLVKKAADKVMQGARDLLGGGSAG